MTGEPSIAKVLAVAGKRRVYEMSDGSVVERDGGTVAWRNNNPGNLKFEYAGDADKTHDVSRSKAQALASAQKRYNGVVDLDQWGNAIFDTLENGREAKIKLLAGKAEMQVPELLKVYSKADYSGPTNHQAQEQAIHEVAESRGLSLRGKRISEMNEAELAALADGIGKFEGFQKGTENVLRPAANAQSRHEDISQDRIILTRAHELGGQYDHVKYGLGSKDVETGKIDCSGWVVKLQNETMQEISQKAGREIFSQSDFFNKNYDASATIIRKGEAVSGVLLSGREVFAPGALKEGMIIGTDNGEKSWDRGYYKGIDHIVMVVRDPETGRLMASQSRGGEGVEVKPLDDYLRQDALRAKGIYATDPLHKARDLLQERVQERQQGRDAPQESMPTTISHGIILKDGSTGASVRDLQEQLAKLGYLGKNGQPLALDGKFGSQTEHAVREFQTMHGLKVDGIVGPQTMNALGQARQQPLITEATHPNHALYQTIAQRLPAGTDPKVAANITLQAMENGIDTPNKVGVVHVANSNVHVLGAGNDPGLRSRTDLNAPTPDLQEMSDHMAREAVQQQQQQQQRQQQHAHSFAQ